MNENNVFAYLKWRGDLSFSASEFNRIDALILNMVSFLDFAGEVDGFPCRTSQKLCKVIDHFLSVHDEKDLNLGLIIPKDIPSLSREVCRSKRFGKICVCHFVNVVDTSLSEQFSAVCYLLDSSRLFISFRGTDDTLVGWAEDVNLLSCFPIPAQADAKKYLERIAELYPGHQIYLGGHSKGGNLSVFAAVYAQSETKKRIQVIYSFDGPGFDWNKIDANLLGEVKDRIDHIMPNNAIVGRLFHLDVKPTIVKSDSKGLDQHNPFSWLIERDDFLTVVHFTHSSDAIKKEIDRMIDGMSEEDKKDFAEDMNRYLDSLKQNHLIEFLNLKNLISLIGNKYKMKNKNIRYLLKLLLIFRRNKAIYIKIQK